MGQVLAVGRGIPPSWEHEGSSNACDSGARGTTEQHKRPEKHIGHIQSWQWGWN